MLILMELAVLVQYPPYFAQPMWIEDRTEYMLIGTLLLLKTALSGTSISHKNHP